MKSEFGKLLDWCKDQGEINKMTAEMQSELIESQREILQVVKRLIAELHTLHSENDTLRTEYEQLRERVERLEQHNKRIADRLYDYEHAPVSTIQMPTMTPVSDGSDKPRKLPRLDVNPKSHTYMDGERLKYE